MTVTTVSIMSIQINSAFTGKAANRIAEICLVLSSD